jgi:ribonuclease PH
MARVDRRKPNQMRPTRIVRNYIKHPEGSVLIAVGDTKVVCTASVEERQPYFMREQHIRNKGWVTAEYSMLPRSTADRLRREVTRGSPGGRTQEIQRLIGRSLRAVVDLKVLGERTIWIDCDVIQADGGTRTASITGAFIALWDACQWLMDRKLITTVPILDHVAATSVGIIDGTPMLDLCYSEDSTADVDMNVIMTGAGKFVEIQGTAEEAPFSKEEADQMLNLAISSIGQLIRLQKRMIIEKRDEASIGNP